MIGHESVTVFGGQVLDVTLPVDDVAHDFLLREVEVAQLVDTLQRIQFYSIDFFL